MVNVEVYHEPYLSDQNDKCSENLFVDDLNCSLPFDLEDIKPICKTYDEGFKMLRSKLVQNENCQQPYPQLEIEYNEMPIQFFLSKVNPKYTHAFIKSSEDEIGYVFQMPQYAK